MRPTRIIFLFSFVGGYADAAGYLLAKSFAGHLTGNTVQAVLHLGQGAWHTAASNASAVAGFLVGTAGAIRYGANAGAPTVDRARHLRTLLLVEGALLLGALGCFWRNDPLGRDAGVFLLCLGLGVQNGSLRSYASLGFHTTYITGVSTSLLASMTTRPATARGDRVPSRRILSGIVLAFVAGALVGGVLSGHYGALGFAGIFVPWCVALWTAWLD